MSESIRKATLNDIPSIRAIAFAAWPVAYAGIISSDQITYMLELMYSESSLQEQINVKHHQFFVLSLHEADAGFASVGDLCNDIYKLHKLYLHPEIKGKGFGKKLLERATSFALENGARQLILQVNRRNPSCQFYMKNGFSVVEETILDIGNGYVMDDYIMGKAL